MIDFGLSASDFATRSLEQHHYLRRQALPAATFGWTELDAILYRIEPQAPSLQLFRDGPIDESAFTDGFVEFGVPRRRLDKARFLRLLHAGATLVVNRMEQHSLPVRRLCSEVGRFAGSVPISNAYLSLGGAGTFGRHWDTHDVFALQLIGRKRWQVFAPTFTQPLAMHRSTGRERDCPAEPLLDVTLEAGDLLYLPRGYWHQAIPLAEPSLHLSVGTYAPTVHDYVSWVCATRLPDLAMARSSLGREPQGAVLADVAERLGELLIDAANVTAYEAELDAREAQPVEFNTGVFFASGPAGLSRDAVVTVNGFRRPERVGRHAPSKEGRLELDPLCRRVIDAAASHEGMSLGALFAALPDADPGTVRLAVIDLELNGIVTVFEP